MNMNLVIADNLGFQAHHLYEQASEFPEYAARNEAAAKEVENLEVLFRNDDTDEDVLREFTVTLGEIDGAASETQAYKRALEDIGFNSHYESAEDFLLAVIEQIKLPVIA
ncbi:hypothetical protein DUT91_09670 [Phyllobacterium salinisoli]|uniref:Uncharacterized protein n=1 Tax=Phyllobacterium salinisoli TaxID=1899321 RepID=A0A368K2X0_9HYPH|nr:hypothetical protein [Phyllobacterium salinisoli]RCS23571.1 hypothetical protein DUT91_09670 [Phyllobacterium salinisoli]